MAFSVRYLTHPQVLIEPMKDVRNWSLNSAGRARVDALAANPGLLSRTRRVICSQETKALQSARPLAMALNVDLDVRPGMHENDRSATGYLPLEEFEDVANQFFAHPSRSVRGWERAIDAQRRIRQEVDDCLAGPQYGDVLFVGHGGVGTLLFCSLLHIKIDRRFDQGPGGGGCWFEFALDDRRPRRTWQPLEALMSGR